MTADVELLRRAATKVREAAKAPQALLPGRWRVDGGVVDAKGDDVVDWAYGDSDEHIALHDPAVALAVADWLDSVVQDVKLNDDGESCECIASDSFHKAVNVARAILREVTP